MQSYHNVSTLRLSHCPEKMAQVAENAAYKKASNGSGKTVSLALSAGVFIGLAFVFYITVTTGSELLGWGIKRLIGGLAFSMGLILLVVCGGELFTSSVLSIIPRATGKLSTRQMMANWGKVYLGNFVGALLLVAVVFAAKLYLLDHGAWGLNALSIAEHKLEHGFLQALMLGLLCNLLVCLAIWMTFSARTSMEKSVLVILPVAMFVSTGFEHVVANMFMVPLGIAIKLWAEPEFWRQAGVSASQYVHLNWHTFVVNNLIPVTLGNMIGGGLIVGLGYWSIYHRGQSASQSEQVNVINPFSIPSGETTMKKYTQLTVADVMQPATNLVTADMSLAAVADALLTTKQIGTVVVDAEMKVQGFISEQDILRSLWLKDYQKTTSIKVASIMQKDVLSVVLNDNLLKLAEFMCVDLSQVYPVSGSGMLLGAVSSSLEERLHKSSVYRPKVFPVVEHGRLVGVVTRHDVLNALRPILGEQLKLEKSQTEQEMRAEVKIKNMLAVA